MDIKTQMPSNNKYDIPNIPVLPMMLTKIPERKWTLYPCNGSYLRIELPHAPNWFHRKLQKLLLGFRYEKINKGKLY